MRASIGWIALLACACGGRTTLRYVSTGDAAVGPTPRCEPTEATDAELLADGWAQTGWVYRHATRGNEQTGTDEMLALAAQHGGERMRFVLAQRSKEAVSAYVVGPNNVTQLETGTRGHIRRIGEVWRRDPEAAREQLQARAQVKADPVVAHLLEGCAANDGQACHQLAEEQRAQRRFVPGDSLDLDQRACELGYAPACAAVAREALIDLRLAELRAKRTATVQRGCQLGDSFCCEIADLIAAYDRGADAAAHSRATELGLAGCDRGDAGLCRFAATRFASTAHGQYGPTDQARADQLYDRGEQLERDACEKGDTSSCESAFFSYDFGEPRERALRELADRLAPLCEQGMSYACFRLARHYYVDRFPDAVQPRALELFETGCDKGLGEACFLGGQLLSEGRGVPRDPARAAAIWAKGCAGGDASSCSSLDER